MSEHPTPRIQWHHLLAESLFQGLDIAQIEAYLKDNPNYDQLKSDMQLKAKTEGKAEGKAEGKKEALIDVIGRILAVRFEQAPTDHLFKQLQLLTPESLNALTEIALTSESLETFEMHVADHLPS